MATSKIQICNLALAAVGADAIRSFDEANKRARLCDVFYETQRTYLLSRFDWPFARRFKQLQQLALDADELPLGNYAYALPADCLTPRDVWPEGSRDFWEVFGESLYTELSAVGLYYTADISDSTKFSNSFVHTMWQGLAVRICPAITQNIKLTQELFSQYRIEERESWENDANVGNKYREYNEHPDNDSFVNPDALLPSEVYGQFS